MRRLLRALFDRDHRNLLAVIFILALCLGVGFGTGYWLLFRMAYAIIIALPILWLIAWFNTRRIDAFALRRTRRAQVGQTAQEVIEVHNRGHIAKVWLEVDDPSGLPGHDARRVIIVPGRRSRSWITDTVLTRRGLFPWGPLTVTGADPFGLFRYTRHFGEADDVLVYPPVVDLPRFQAPPASLPGEGTFRRRTHYVTPNASGVRQYSPGDAMSRIHWKSTARTGELMVKTFELDPASDIWVIADLEQRVHLGEGDESTEEYAVRAAASIARHFILANRSVGLITFGRDLDVVEPERGSGHMDRILESLALARAVGDAPLSNILLEEQRRFGRHTSVIAITPSLDEDWVLSILSLAQRGVRVAAVLIDPSTFGRPDKSALITFGELTAAGVLTYILRKGDELSLALSADGPGVVAWQA